MGLVSGFVNSFTSGEICEDAWDRVDIQPVVKGCALAENYVVRIAGPLGKRRGFWLNGTVYDQSKLARLIPFSKSVTDSLFLEFGDLTCRVWQSNGAPLLSGGVQVEFSTPYTQYQLAGLRFKQVKDVIYFRHATGLQPRALTRASDTSWSWAIENFPNGPWLPENIDNVTGVQVIVSSLAVVNDANSQTSAAYIPVGSNVTLQATASLFNANQVGSYIKLRSAPGTISGASWQPGTGYSVGEFCISVGNLYVCTQTASSQSGFASRISNPPVHTFGIASDGGNQWKYVGDGNGIVQITSYISPNEVAGTITAAVPFGLNANTTYWAFSAYSNDRGWPRCWPALREERLVGGGTASNLDMLDLTESAGFYPTSENYHASTGNGTVVATDAIRRRIGDDGGEILWAHVATYLAVGTASGEYLVAGSVLDEPLSPAGVTIKQLSAYGSADVYPARAHKGVLYVTRAGQVLRELTVDTQQQASTDDLTVLARHIADRGFAQLCWILAPDETLWCRMADGGLACFVYHQEQQVKGWCSVALPAGWICEDIAALPGPGGYQTLWAILSRTKAGVTQRVIVMQSQPSDNLFLDLASAYSGAAVSQLTGLDLFDGETLTAMANGAPVTGVVSNAGALAVPAGTTEAQVGFPVAASFKSLPLDLAQAGGSLGKRERAVGAIIRFKGAVCQVGVDGGPLEQVSTRTQADIPNITPKRKSWAATFAGGGGPDGREPQIVFQDSSPFDSVIYSIRPKVVVGD